MTFTETLLSDGYTLFDGAYVKTDENGFTYSYQQDWLDENEWNYVKMSPLCSVVEQYTVTV